MLEKGVFQDCAKNSAHMNVYINDIRVKKEQYAYPRLALLSVSITDIFFLHHHIFINFDDLTRPSKENLCNDEAHQHQNRSTTVVLNPFGGTEPHKFHTCIHKRLYSWKIRMCFSSNSKYMYIN